MPGDRFNYNKAGAESANEQILLNIVRLRYRQPVYFVEVTSMLNQYTFQAGANYRTWWNDLNIWPNAALRAAYGVDNDPSEQSEWGGNVGYVDRPTISYAPLQGKDFAARVMTPIPTSVIIYLSQSGWDIDQLLECCVQRLNDVRNTPIHNVGGDQAWSTAEFARVASLLKQVQDTGELNLTVEVDRAQNANYLAVPAPTQQTAALAKELSELLDLRSDVERIRIVPAGVRHSENELVMQTRSMMGVMNALAQLVDAPRDHVASGQVRNAGRTSEAAQEHVWLRVRHARLPQPDAFVQVYYHDYWWYIDESDWTSKGTFALLSYLFQLQASEVTFQTPIVTVPAGG